MNRCILCLNAGSSSLKFALFDANTPSAPSALRGSIEAIGIAPHLIMRSQAGTVVMEHRWADAARTHEQLLGEVLERLEGEIGKEFVAVGHRIVHGGTAFVGPVRLDPDVVDRLAALSPLAPLHQPHNLSAVRAIRDHRPFLPQIGCFDTAFHHTQPEVARRYGLPRRLHDEGILRYGFHGLSYEYVARRLAQIAPDLADGRVLIAHLGNGASLCGLRGGASIDTTMGFSTLDGLVMGTRCGALDPAIALYLVDQKGMTAAEVEALLYEQSGLLGVSGISSDMRVLLASSDSRARGAIELFVYQLARQAGGLISSLGGLDALIFTGGIGENAAEIRRQVCARLAWTGATLDDQANRKNAERMSATGSSVAILVIPTDEERMIATHCMELLNDAR